MQHVVMVPSKNQDTLQIHGVNVKASDNVGKFFFYKDILYHALDGKWWESQKGSAAGTQDQEDDYNALRAHLNTKVTAYKTGGLADFTGPAWLDGTPSKPEYILNAAQTERFFSLIDVLEGYDKDKETKKPSGDNYFDISINVEKLESDYDVEQIADKIRRMIHEDAMYRNVNSINLIR
jgi:hypothetical protein